MTTLVTSFIAGLLVVVYLGYYAVTLNQLPLWIVIVGVLAMVIIDFVVTARDELQRSGKNQEDNGG